MKRTFSLLYGIICYLIFFGTFLYTIGFVGNLIVSKTIDGKLEGPLFSAILVDASLLLLFALQHSIMARPGFKKWWAKFVPVQIERSSFVILASLCLILIMREWKPVGGTIWSIENEGLKASLNILYLVGWLIILASTFLINHFDLFGLRQVWLYFLGKPYVSLPFGIPLFYKLVRHPLYLGFLVAFWSAPVMTVAHLLFAIVTTSFILTAIQFEERDLPDHVGDKYRSHKKKIPMILPFQKSQTKEAAASDRSLSRSNQARA
jgi:methanethiol S-methyltransferase